MKCQPCVLQIYQLLVFTQNIHSFFCYYRNMRSYSIKRMYELKMMLEHQQEGGPSKIAFQDRGDGGVVAAAEKVQVYQQEVELVQIDLHVVVAHFGNLVVVGVVKG